MPELSHLVEAGFHLCTEFWRKDHILTASGLPAEKGSGWNIADKHFLQAHSLGTELKLIGVVFPGRTPLVFDREWQIQPLLPSDGYALGISSELYNITCAGDSQPWGEHPHVPCDQQVSPTLPCRCVVSPSVEALSFYRPNILRSLIFNVNQRPLPPTKTKMLNPGD